MGLVATLLPALLAADPSTAAVLARRTNVSGAEANSLAAQAAAALSADGVPMLPDAELARRLTRLGLKDASTCGGKTACLTEVGRQLKLDWLVSVSVSRLENDRSVALELLKLSAGTVVEKESLLLPAKTKLTADLLEGFSQRVKLALGLVTPPPVEPPKPPDAPVVTKLEPVKPPDVVIPAPPPPRSHRTSFVLGGAAVAALGTAAALLAVGLSTQASLSTGTSNPDGRLRSELTGSEAQARANAAGLQLGLAGAAAAVGAGLGTAAVVTW